MSLAATTLSAKIGASDTSFGVASATNITAPNFTTGVGVTYLLVEAEIMLVTAVSGTVISVIRGQLGTQAVSHAASTVVVSGGVTPQSNDFSVFSPAVTTTTDAKLRQFDGISAPVASATTITPSGPIFHVTGTTATATINLPTGFVEGEIEVIADGIWTWTAAGNIAVAGTVTTAGSRVKFRYDQGTGKWYPSRLA